MKTALSSALLPGTLCRGHSLLSHPTVFVLTNFGATPFPQWTPPQNVCGRPCMWIVEENRCMVDWCSMVVVLFCCCYFSASIPGQICGFVCVFHTVHLLLLCICRYVYTIQVYIEVYVKVYKTVHAGAGIVVIYSSAAGVPGFPWVLKSTKSLVWIFQALKNPEIRH